MATRAPLEHELFYVILLEIMFNVSSLDGNTGSAEYSKKKCTCIYSLSKPLLDINYLTVMFIPYKKYTI